MTQTPAEYALELCQKFGSTTMFTEANNGYTLPLEIAKKCALIHVKDLKANLQWLEDSINFDKAYNYYNQVEQAIPNI